MIADPSGCKSNLLTSQGYNKCIENEQIINNILFMKHPSPHKWTSTLVEAFSSSSSFKEPLSTTYSSSLNKFGSHTNNWQCYKEMPQHYRNYADSLDAKRTKYSNTFNNYYNASMGVSKGETFDSASKWGFVNYRHQPHHNFCAQQCTTLKKKAKRHCHCKCKENKQPQVIKEIHTVYVQPQTVIRQVAPPPIVTQKAVIREPTIMRPAPITRKVEIVDNSPSRILSKSRSNSQRNVSFTYASPQRYTVSSVPKNNAVQSVIVNSPVTRQEYSPYKQLNSSRKSERKFLEVVSSPKKSNTGQNPHFSFAWEKGDSSPLKKSSTKKPIFYQQPEVEAQTAHFIVQVTPPLSRRTDKSQSSLQIFNGQRSMNNSDFFRKNKPDPILE